jgi:hypothetical protein
LISPKASAFLFIRSTDMRIQRIFTVFLKHSDEIDTRERTGLHTLRPDNKKYLKIR